MNNENKFLELCRIGNIEVNEFLNCEFEGVKINEADSSMRFCLVNDKLVLVPTIKRLIDSLTEIVNNKFGFKNVKLTIKYDANILPSLVLQGDELKEYYQYAKEICKQVSKSVIILDEYFTRYEENKLILMVATLDDKKVAEQNLALIHRFFYNYGLTFVKFDVVVSDSVKNQRARAEMKQRVKEQINETKAMEEYKQR